VIPRKPTQRLSRELLHGRATRTVYREVERESRRCGNDSPYTLWRTTGQGTRTLAGHVILGELTVTKQRRAGVCV